jgi:hypothetical protein
MPNNKLNNKSDPVSNSKKLIEPAPFTFKQPLQHYQALLFCVTSTSECIDNLLNLVDELPTIDTASITKPQSHAIAEPALTPRLN